MECLLDCVEWDWLEFERLYCKTVDNKTSWHTLANERITLEMIRGEGLCATPPIEAKERSTTE